MTDRLTIPLSEVPTHELGALEAECALAWAKVFPFKCPPIVKLVPGQVVFIGEAKGEAA